MWVRRFLGLGAGLVVLVGCAGPPTPAARDIARVGTAPEPAPSHRTMNMIVRYEVADLAPKIPGQQTPVATERLFNAALAFIDGDEVARPYLAEALPRLNTDTWKVFPDGRMETTYKLRPNLIWHDGKPLTADDFLFAYSLYTASELADVFGPTPQDKMDGVAAPDPRTLVIRWRLPYPEAGSIVVEELEPLPRHILEPAYQAVQQDPAAREAFAGLRFWTQDYVGAGPFKLESWVPGSHLEGSAFDGHALGRPRIERIMVRMVGDENAVLTNVLAGGVDFTGQTSLRFEHALVLQRDWVPAGKGNVILERGFPRMYLVQMRPEFAEHAGQLDVRIRRALAYGIDRQALNDALFDGQGFMSETFVPTASPYFAEVDRTVTKYPYDPRRAEQAMAEAGYTKDREGFFANAAGQQFHTDLRVGPGIEFERGQAILVDTWRRAGFQMSSSLNARSPDTQSRHNFPGIAFRSGDPERVPLSSEIGTAQNRWFGENRGGYASREYDRLFDLYATTLDPRERTRHYAEMIKVLTDDVPMYVTNFAIGINSYSAALHGPTNKTVGHGEQRGTLPYWNIHEWELR